MMFPCRFPFCRSLGQFVRLPMSDRFVVVCERHRPVRVLAAMRGLFA